MPVRNSQDDAVEYIYTAFITLKNGKRIYASQYGIESVLHPCKTQEVKNS